MLVMVVVVMSVRCVKLVGANSYRMLILVIQQKVGRYRGGRVRYIPIEGAQPIKIHVAGWRRGGA